MGKRHMCSMLPAGIFAWIACVSAFRKGAHLCITWHQSWFQCMLTYNNWHKKQACVLNGCNKSISSANLRKSECSQRIRDTDLVLFDHVHDCRPDSSCIK